MICDSCGAAEREQREGRFICEIGDRLIAVDNVPAEVRPTCGGTIYSPKVVARLHELLLNDNQNPDKIGALHFQYAKSV